MAQSDIHEDKPGLIVVSSRASFHSCLAVYPGVLLFVSIACKTPCEKLINKGALSLGSSASLPAQTGSRENMPMLNTKILFPSKTI